MARSSCWYSPSPLKVSKVFKRNDLGLDFRITCLTSAVKCESPAYQPGFLFSLI